MTSERSYEAPDGSFYYSLEVRGKIVVGRGRGIQGGDASRALIAMLEEARAEVGAGISWLSDASDIETLTPEGRKLITDYTMGEDSPFTRIAVVGPNALIRTIINLFVRISKVPVRVFKREEDALPWLEGSDS